MKIRGPQFSALAFVAALSACAGGTVSPLPKGDVAQVASAGSKTQATVLIFVHHPAARRGKRTHSHYVSPATQSISITVTPPQGRARHFNANLTPPTNPNCKSYGGGVACQLTLLLPAGKYTAAFATFDGLLSGTGVPTGNELSANQSVPFTLRTGKRSVIPVTLDGVPVSLAFIPGASSALSGNASTGYQIPRCNVPPQQVTVLSVDADGNFILGSGAPTMSLQSGSALITVATPKPSQPNTFTVAPVAPPSYAPPGSTVYLEAKASPPAQSGAGTPTQIVQLTFSTNICGVITEFPVPTSSSFPWAITIGPDNAIWFTELGGNKIGRIPTTATAANPQITEFPLPTRGAPFGIATGADGALWFTECSSSQIGRMLATGPPILEFPTPTLFSHPRSIAAGPDGAMWFTETAVGNIGRIPTSGPLKMQEFPVPTVSSQPSGIVAGPDGKLWFTEAKGNKIATIPTSGAPITEWALSTPNASPRVITVGPDGNLWFTEENNGTVGTIRTSGSPIVEFPPPQGTGDSYGITSGPDGALWFVTPFFNSIDRVTTAGIITLLPVPTPMSRPPYIILGPDGALWFTESGSNKIGRLQ